MNAPATPQPPLQGLVAATFTPFDTHGNLLLDRVPAITRHLADNGIEALYVCGSTGEGPSLTLEERKAVARAYRQAAPASMRTVVHVGHTCLRDAQELARHAAEIGADFISAVAPYYFKPLRLDALVDFLAELCAAAPELPFFYYHIPALTGLGLDPEDLLRTAEDRLPTLRGIKYTDTDLAGFVRCHEVAKDQYDLLFGRDEMLLPALAAGARGAVGSTYNLAPALYRTIIEAFAAGDLDTARQAQETAVGFIQALLDAGGEAAIKYPMKRLGLDCGPRRLPMHSLTPAEAAELDRQLDALGFDGWAVAPTRPASATLS